VGKNVAVFVDVANIFYAAKAAGVDIDYVTLLKASTAGRDLVRAYAYTGLDPENENQRNFHEFLRRSNYKVVSKDIRKYGDGKVKANLDIELVVDMMKTARNLDIAIVVSGDGDFAPAIRAVQEQGVRVEVISFRGNTSSDLIDVADQFTDIVQLARVEKGTRSGRRVADDEADLSMTEVPDKQTEGTGAGRGRGRRGRGRTEDAVAATATGGRSRSRGRAAAPDAVAASATEEQGGLVALPGERLSRAVGSLTEEDLARAEVFTFEDAGSDLEDGTEAGDGDHDESAEGQRRRRRRGGRGRGRGRGRSEETAAATTNGSGRYEPAAPRSRDEDLDVPPRAPRPTPFGSVWDSQLGTPPPARATSPAPIDEDEDFDEPEIPEYLIAEQRRAGRGQGGRGARGGRSAYQSAMDRERYGRGGGGGINRYPDVSGRNRQAPPREDRSRSRAPERAPAPAGRTSDEPWSDVPPELEAMLRAQVSQRPGSDARPVMSGEDVLAAVETEPVELSVGAEATAEAAAPAKATRTRTTRKSTTTAAKAPARTRTTHKAAPAAADATADAAAAEVAEGSPAAAAKPAKATRTRTTRKSTTKASGTAEATPGDDRANPTEAAPRRRSTRKAATATSGEATEGPETA
jgi:uncharacterized LabA/DUF88 family protein